jgi:hypothetical protein
MRLYTTQLINMDLKLVIVAVITVLLHAMRKKIYKNRQEFLMALIGGSLQASIWEF